MTAPRDTRPDVPPSATPTEAEVAAWAALPRDDQVRLYAEALAHPDCSAESSDNMREILAAARLRAVARADG